MARVLAFDDDSSSVSGGGTPPPPPAQQPQNKAGGATSRPLKRVARFLGDDASDDDNNDNNGFSAAAYGSGPNANRRDLAGLGAAGQKKKKTTVQDVDRMFADLDEDDDDGLGVPLAQRKNNDLPSNSIINDTITGFNGDDGDAPNDKIDAEKARKVRRKPVLMNEERLLGDKGIRRLKENLKGFKIKGKGHEEDDLRRLMNVYQLWAHQMYPAGSFKDTITQVEKLCKKRAVKGILKGWRDEASGKLPPPLSGRDDNSDAEDGPTRHANSDDDDEVEVQAYAGQATTTSQAGSPERVAPKKSYFDDIPTSSPGGALERDPDMADEEFELAESLFGSAAPAAMNSQAGPSTATAIRATTSEAGFNDADLTFDLEEEDFDMDAEAEAAMREMDNMNDDFFNSGPATTSSKGKGKETENLAQSTTKPGVKTNAAISFYAEPKASERARNGKSLVQETSRQLPSSSPAPKRSDLHEEEENFDDFDFGDEEDIMREMEQADKKQKEREAAALAAEKRAASVGTATGTTSGVEESTSKTPSLTTSSSAQDVDFDLDDAFDEDFLKGIDEAEISMSQRNKITERSSDEDFTERAASPVKLLLPGDIDMAQEVTAAQPKSITEASQSLVQEEKEEEDLYS